MLHDFYAIFPMNKRLKKIYEFISNGLGLVDVGTDHGYLPVYLAQNGYTGNIIATDIRPKPLAAARRSALAAGQSERISFLLCDGLELCPPDKVDTIVIAGMGGDTICGILDRAEWSWNSRYLHIYQPMTKPQVLRYWLIYNGFEILSEALVKDSGVIYPVIAARFGGETQLSDGELFVGKYDLLRAEPLFVEFCAQQIQRLENVLNGIERSSATQSTARQKIIINVLDELKSNLEGSAI